jgi:magnesium transporter
LARASMNPTAKLLEPEVRELIQQSRWGELRECMHFLPAADVADILAELPPDEAALGFRFLQRNDAGDVFSYLSQEKQEELIQKLGAEGSVRVVESMSADDRARLLDELPHEVAQRIVAALSPEERKVTQAILGYPPGTVGRLMTPDYIRVRPEWTIEKTLDYIRQYGKDAETLNVVYVVDDQGTLIDDIRLRAILLSPLGTTIESLMNRSFQVLRADQPESDAVEMMAKYDRTALPVVDSRGILVGIVTIDDVVDVARQEATEDIQKMGGMGALDEPFDKAGVFWLLRKRAPWLALLFMSELLTSNALVYFDDQIKKAAILAAFVPAIISSGGNSGSQASTLVIRALALGEIRLSDWWRILRREFAVAGLLGLLIGGIGFFRISLWGWMGWWVEDKVDPITNQPVYDPETGKRVLDFTVQDHYTLLGVAISVSLVGVVLWGSIMGAMLPFLLKKCRLDPAGSSTPFVATLVDVTGIIIYFTTAMLILKGTLL